MAWGGNKPSRGTSLCSQGFKPGWPWGSQGLHWSGCALRKDGGKPLRTSPFVLQCPRALRKQCSSPQPSPGPWALIPGLLGTASNGSRPLAHNKAGPRCCRIPHGLRAGGPAPCGWVLTECLLRGCPGQGAASVLCDGNVVRHPFIHSFICAARDWLEAPVGSSLWLTCVWEGRASEVD